MGHDESENRNLLIEWLHIQDKETYTTSWEQCITDITKITQYIYDNDLGLTNDNIEIKITYSEMLNILKAKNMNDKLIAYSMLIHSKRYANKQGIFYMTYKQMAETSGMSERTAIRTIKKLEELKAIEVIERNVCAGNSKTKFKKPNKYRMLEVESEIKIELTYDNDYLNNVTNINDILTTSIIGLFNYKGVTSISDLQLLIPKGQYYTYKSIIDNYTNSITDSPKK
jgi:DNA-binding Lrp family transcriptional regulator